MIDCIKYKAARCKAKTNYSELKAMEFNAMAKVRPKNLALR